MTNIYTDILSWLIFLILASTLFLMFFWMWSSIRSKVPFVTVPVKTLSEIEKALNLNENSVVYDLGSGDGRVLFYLYKNNPKVKYIGIENNKFALLLARISNWWHKKMNKSDIKIIDDDFFNVDLSSATHIFTYLYPNIMDDLVSKLSNELKPGTKLISMSFHFTSKREKEVIDLKRGKYQLARKIYVYEF